MIQYKDCFEFKIISEINGREKRESERENLKIRGNTIQRERERGNGSESKEEREGEGVSVRKRERGKEKK